MGMFSSLIKCTWTRVTGTFHHNCGLISNLNSDEIPYWIPLLRCSMFPSHGCVIYFFVFIALFFFKNPENGVPVHCPCGLKHIVYANSNIFFGHAIPIQKRIILDSVRNLSYCWNAEFVLCCYSYLKSLSQQLHLALWLSYFLTDLDSFVLVTHKWSL